MYALGGSRQHEKRWQTTCVHHEPIQRRDSLTVLHFSYNRSYTLFKILVRHEPIITRCVAITTPKQRICLSIPPRLIHMLTHGSVHPPAAVRKAGSKSSCASIAQGEQNPFPIHFHCSGRCLAARKVSCLDTSTLWYFCQVIKCFTRCAFSPGILRVASCRHRPLAKTQLWHAVARHSPASSHRKLAESSW